MKEQEKAMDSIELVLDRVQVISSKISELALKGGFSDELITYSQLIENILNAEDSKIPAAIFVAYYQSMLDQRGLSNHEEEAFRRILKNASKDDEMAGVLKEICLLGSRDLQDITNYYADLLFRESDDHIETLIDSVQLLLHNSLMALQKMRQGLSMADRGLDAFLLNYLRFNKEMDFETWTKDVFLYKIYDICLEACASDLVKYIRLAEKQKQDDLGAFPPKGDYIARKLEREMYNVYYLFFVIFHFADQNIKTRLARLLVEAGFVSDYRIDREKIIDLISEVLILAEQKSKLGNTIRHMMQTWVSNSSDEELSSLFFILGIKK